MRAYRAGVAFDGDRFLDGGALVLVDGGRIVGVEPARTDPPDGVPVTDLPGGTLVPGLVDTHTHLCGDSGNEALTRLETLADDAVDDVVRASLAAQLDAGVTAVRDLGDARWAVVDRHRGHDEGPTVVASGPPVTVPGGHCFYLGGEASGRDALVTAVRARAGRGADVVKIMTSGGMLTAQTDVTAPQFALDDLRAMVDAAHDAGLPVTGHAHAARAVEDCVAAGVDGVEHCSNITGAGQHATPELLERLAASGIAVCPTLGRFPGIDYPAPISALMAQLAISEETILENTATLLAAGVRIVSGADSGIYPDKAHGVLPWSLVWYARAGAAPAEMLTSGTGRAADVVGLGDRTGRLRPGLDADLLLLDGDVRADPLAVTRVRTVVSRGRVVRSDV